MRSFTGMLGTSLSGPGNVVPGLAPGVAIKAKKCHFPVSSWVYAFILTCDDKLAVWFKRRARRRLRATVGGVPGVCCLYPQSNRQLYDLAVVWWSAGHFVHQFLYRILAYVPVAPPKAPCGNDCPPGVVVSCCPNALPETLHVTFTGSLMGTYPITYDTTLGFWRNPAAAVCGSLSLLGLVCTAGTWTFGLDAGGGANPCRAVSVPASSASCAPLALTFGLTGAGGCCNGQSFTATVTT